MSDTKGKRRRRGQVIVLAPVMVVVLGAMLALTSDVGNLFVWRARLQNGADAAALAGMHAYARARLDGSDEETARAVGQSEADAIYAENCAGAALTLQFGELDENRQFVARDTATPATAVQATSVRDETAADGPVDLVFSALIGMSTCDVATDAVAELTSSFIGVSEGCAPFAVPESAIGPPGTEMVFYPSDEDSYDGLGDQTVAPGCWGLLNLDGGSLGTDEMKYYIEHGYDGTFQVDPETGYVWIDGTSGFRAALQSVTQDKIGEELVMIVYDQVVGEGANADFRAVGFLVVEITYVRFTGVNPHLKCQVLEKRLLKHFIWGPGMDGSPNIQKIQLAG